MISPARFTDHVPPSKNGSALLIVLMMIVLLTGLVIAFLSQSMLARKVANGSANETGALLLANTAGDIIVGDFKQEIVAGSANVGTSSWPVYVPSTNQAMIPWQNGVPVTSGTNAIPNMISRSVRPGNTAGAAPYAAYPSWYTTGATPPNRAADDTATPANVSTITPSLNGRSIKAAQWNSHYLIPRDSSLVGTTKADSTPVSTFVAPDWVVVTRSGANSGVTWNSSLADPTASNTSYAVGRYAYAVYNEGGLLDMNAAGYPQSGLTAAQISQKGSMALADLTQLSVGGTFMSTSQINNIVGWRNYYTAQLNATTGAFGNVSFSSTTASNWLTNFVAYNAGNTNTTVGSNGFLSVNTNALTNPAPPTDQALVSRQQLIGLAQSLAISPDFLQYMGTFSRAVEQPSYVPDPNRPRIINSSSGAPPAATAVDSYLGNNDGEGGDDAINPSFLSIRVGTSFTRLNGAAAVVGEPLVKTKFPLSRLALVTYSATATGTQTNSIYANFGLSRASASAPWTYNHGQNSIMTLAQVAALTGANAREPDFAELLKAAICAGSLAKGGPNLHNSGCNYQYSMDTGLDYQVLQIMANLIDQQDADSYPTVIQIQVPASPSYYRTFYGVEDLPYFYRYHLMSVVDQLPAPILTATSTATFFAVSGVTTSGTCTSATTFPYGVGTTATWSATPGGTVTTSVSVNRMAKGTFTTAGEAAFMYILDLWNPHDQNTLASSSSGRPTQFRVFATNNDPVSLTGTWQVMARSNYNASNSILPVTTSPSAGITLSVYPTSAPKTLSVSNTALTFSDNGGTLFREPTLLWNSGNQGPTGLSLSGVDSVTDINTFKTYYGIIVGRVPIDVQVSFVSTPAQGTDGAYYFQGNTISAETSTQSGTYPQITFTLQYLDPNNSSNWITYDVKYPDLHGMSNPNLIVNQADYANASYTCPLNNNQMNGNASCVDPRSARWGVGTNSTLGNGTTGGDYLLEATANQKFALNNLAGWLAIKTTNFSIIETDRPTADRGNLIFYSAPCATHDAGRNQQMRWFSPIEYRSGSSTTWNGSPTSPFDYDGLFSQNNPAIQSSFLAQDNLTADQIYYEDPDGVARRAMGAYAGTATFSATKTASLLTSNTGNTASTVGLPLATANYYALLNYTGTGVATAQAQSRPIILNRPFRSVSEMSYTFRGTPWKNIDFFTPESGDSALLDTFCASEPPVSTNPIVAGKVDLNTRQIPVLQAVIANAYRDESKNVTSPPSYALSQLSGTEASKVATKLVGITTDTADMWRGPLVNISGLVGRFVANPGTTTVGTIGTDWYTYAPPSPVSGQPSSVTYAGLSGVLDSTVYNTTLPTGVQAPAPYTIQRFREAALRPLTDVGQVRVWNLLIDVVAQTGRYPKTATNLSQFEVDGQKHIWLHVAIDRYTGQVLDKQVEIVTQ